MTAPVALFVFNRPDHLRRTIESLRACNGFEDTLVTVFADGPRDATDEAAVRETRAIATSMLPGAEFRFAEQNRGLANSIIGGVEHLLGRHGRVIVVEDDLILDPGFLRWMNAALDHFEDDVRVYQVSGHMFDVPNLTGRHQALLLPLTTTWGWATWARAWRAFDADAQGWYALRSDAALRRRFNVDGAYDYAQMLEKQMEGRRQSWGIRWYWSVFRRSGLCCFPPRSLVDNTGMDGSGTHGRGRFRRFGVDVSTPVRARVPLVFAAPTPAVIDQAAWAAVARAIWTQNGGHVGRVLDSIRRLRDRLVSP